MDCLWSPSIAVLGFETSGDAEAEGCVKTPGRAALVFTLSLLFYLHLILGV